MLQQRLPCEEGREHSRRVKASASFQRPFGRRKGRKLTVASVLRCVRVDATAAAVRRASVGQLAVSASSSQPLQLVRAEIAWRSAVAYLGRPSGLL